MNKYEVYVTKEYTAVIEVSASSYQEAENIAYEKYSSGEILCNEHTDTVCDIRLIPEGSEFKAYNVYAIPESKPHGVLARSASEAEDIAYHEECNPRCKFIARLAEEDNWR